MWVDQNYIWDYLKRQERKEIFFFVIVFVVLKKIGEVFAVFDTTEALHMDGMIRKELLKKKADMILITRRRDGRNNHKRQIFLSFFFGQLKNTKGCQFIWRKSYLIVAFVLLIFIAKMSTRQS